MTTTKEQRARKKLRLTYNQLRDLVLAVGGGPTLDFDGDPSANDVSLSWDQLSELVSRILLLGSTDRRRLKAVLRQAQVQKQAVRDFLENVVESSKLPTANDGRKKTHTIIALPYIDRLKADVLGE